ncbi:MAG: hypothetical protein WKF57_06210 [Nakamurella sp.]
MSNAWLTEGARKVRARRDALPLAARPVITVPGQRQPLITTLADVDRAAVELDAGTREEASVSMTMFEVYEGDSDYLLLVTSDRSLARETAEPGDRIITVDWSRSKKGDGCRAAG